MTTADEQPDDLFPLPLSSMEQFHLLDAPAEFPNEIFGRLRFSGELDRAAAMQAIEKVVQRQSMLGARVVVRGSSHQWQYDANSPLPVHFQTDEQDMPALDVRSGYPWLVVFRVQDGGAEMWFRASHALLDGLGAMQLISDWANYYHQCKCPDSKAKRLNRLQPARLRLRNSLGLMSVRYLKRLWLQPIGLLGAVKFINRRPAETFSKTTDEPWSDLRQPGVIGVWLDGQTTGSLKKLAMELDVSLNSIFLGQLMRALESAAAQNPQRGSPWIRVLHPMSIRSIGDRKLPACNRTTIVQIDRRAEEFNDDDFFKSLDREIDIIRSWELGKLFLLAIRAFSVSHWLLKRSTGAEKCRATAVLANLGEPLGRLKFPADGEDIQIGNLGLVDFDFVGPVRFKTPFSFSVQKHLSRFRLSLHFDPRIVDEDTAFCVLRSFQSALSKIADQTSD